MGLLGSEGVILRRTIIPTVYDVALAGVLTFVARRVLGVTDPMMGVKF